MMDVKFSKGKHINRWVDRENLIYIRLNIFKNQKPCIKKKEVIKQGKRSKTLNEVKPNENIEKNLQSFLEISSMQKEVLPSHKLQHYAYHRILLN